MRSLGLVDGPWIIASKADLPGEKILSGLEIWARYLALHSPLVPPPTLLPGNWLRKSFVSEATNLTVNGPNEKGKKQTL